MIYFVQRPDRAIKIGTTIQLSVRLKALVLEHGELVVLAVADGSFEVEQAIHQRFAHLRVHNEWFEPGDDLKEFMASHGRAWNGLDDVMTTGSAKLEMDVVRSARVVCSLRDTNMTRLLSGMLRDDLARMEEEEIAKRAKRKGPKS